MAGIQFEEEIPSNSDENISFVTTDEETILQLLQDSKTQNTSRSTK